MLIPAEPHRLRSHSEVVLRSPKSDDANALLVFIRQLTAESHQHLIFQSEDVATFTLEDEMRLIERWSAQPNGFALAAFTGDEIVANLVVMGHSPRVQQHRATLAIGILEIAQGIGLGRLLSQEALAIASKNGIWNIDLAVRTFNTRAIALYESLGFKRVGRMEKVAYIDSQFFDEYVYQILLKRPSCPER